jgi:hypothetical protein
MKYRLGDLIKFAITHQIIVGKIFGVYNLSIENIDTYGNFSYVVTTPVYNSNGTVDWPVLIPNYGDQYSCKDFIIPTTSNILQFKFVPIYEKEVICKI